ncbi:unnamed protein product [Rhizoctonia solani]|uniref:Peptidase M43 pregnancy-associated plasma-A domain-containing protein n=1 Tax=Rhizoctonia solani TaxID=456999 RepID=A0A8H3BF31_9AGAM|nr:unnamed protein product [Rhizoctonia solani]
MQLLTIIDNINHPRLPVLVLNQGNIPDSQISASITALNQHYSGSGITFNLIDTNRTTNSDWFSRSSIGSTQQTEMKAALRQGSAATLNIYTTGNTLSQGYATFPSEYTKNPVDDGVVVLYSTLPGGSFAPFNEGKTLTHEVGHWLGLYHTFQGGCSNPGDFVDDTPPQARPSSGCPIGQDTCPGGGVDPIHNFMDYSDDSCLTEFTSGQFVRIKDQIATYRGIIV